MTNLLIKVLESGREKFRHTAAESADFTMLTVSGTPTNPNDVLKEQQLGPTVTAVGQRNTWELAALTTANAADKYFTQNTTTGEYYVWYNLDLGGIDPLVSGKTGIPVAISTGDDAAAIAQKTSSALEAHAAFTSTSLGTVVTIDDANPGVVSGGPTSGTLSGLISGYITIIGADARLGGIATLNSNGKLNANQVPAIAITDTFVVASQSAMLALSTAETGDVAIRTDLNKSFILSGTYSTLADWKELLSPTDAVSSVNGQTGIVVLNTDNISESGTPTNKWFTESRVRSTVLTGLNTSSGGTIAAADTILEAFGKVEYRVALNDAKVSYSASTARSDLIETASITDGETNKAPCSNLVFDALAGKAAASHTHSSTDITDFASAAKSAAVVNTLTGSETDQAPSVYAVNQALGNLSAQYKSYTNDTASTLTIRQVVYVKSNGKIDLAKADAIGTCGSKLGFVRDTSIINWAAGNITIATGSVISGFSSLTPGAGVWLSPTTAGDITQTCPSTVGQFVVYLGEALSDTEVEFKSLPAVEIVS